MHRHNSSLLLIFYRYFVFKINEQNKKRTLRYSFLKMLTLRWDIPTVTRMDQRQLPVNKINILFVWLSCSALQPFHGN